jgi:hypothetical protein
MIHTVEPGLNSTSQLVPQVKTLVKAEGLEGVAVDAEDKAPSCSKLTIIDYNVSS